MPRKPPRDDGSSWAYQQYRRWRMDDARRRAAEAGLDFDDLPATPPIPDRRMSEKEAYMSVVAEYEDVRSFADGKLALTGAVLTASKIVMDDRSSPDGLHGMLSNYHKWLHDNPPLDFFTSIRPSNDLANLLKQIDAVATPGPHGAVRAVADMTTRCAIGA